MTQDSICEITNCGQQVVAESLCSTHYEIELIDRFGVKRKRKKVLSDDERFWAKVDAEGDCWLWTAYTEHGYGQFWFEGKSVKAYRYSWETLVGVIPKGLVLDHLCRNPPCVNPDHLEPVTSGENTRRGIGTGGNRHWSARKTHCKNGHKFTQENTRWHGPDKNKRQCRTCHNLYARKLRARRK